MDTILWTQNETPLTPSTLIIDSVRSEFEGLKVQEDAMKVISSTSNWKIVKDGRSVVKFKNGEGFVISSCFDNKDEAGRPMAFLFFSKNNDFRIVINNLKENIDQLDRTFNYWEDLDPNSILSKIEKSKKKKMFTSNWMVIFRIGIVSFGLAWIGIIIAKICTHNTKNDYQKNNENQGENQNN